MSNLKRYIISIKEVHQTQFETKAACESEALNKALSGDGIWLDNTTEFIETLEPEYWECEEVGDA